MKRILAETVCEYRIVNALVGWGAFLGDEQTSVRRRRTRADIVAEMQPLPAADSAVRAPTPSGEVAYSAYLYQEGWL
jgi:hypothetical protein